MLGLIFRDPSFASCMFFGLSGSGVMRKEADFGEDEYGNSADRYSWVGPLSFYKGCDKVWDLSKIGDELNYAGENPGVITSGHCYLDWIAEQYNMKPPVGYVKLGLCSESRGSREDVNKTGTECLTTKKTTCDFNSTRKDDQDVLYDKCKTYSEQGYAFPVNRCFDTEVHLIIIFSHK